MNKITNDILMHIGVARRSGRYPWGSGDNPRQRTSDFVSRFRELKDQGLSQIEIAKVMGLGSTDELRVRYSNEINLEKSRNIATALSKAKDGKSPTQIGKEMGINESTIRGWLKDGSQAKARKAVEIADYIQGQVDKYGMVDVGSGVENTLNISKEKLKQALAIMEERGYPIHGGRVPQVNSPVNKTTLKAVCAPGTPPKAIFQFQNGVNPIHLMDDAIVREDKDGNDRVEPPFVYPKSMASSRMKVRYGDEGGSDKDGVIEIRRGVPDLDLGKSNYAQVRILVDDKHYIKGMAIYSDDIPEGSDLVFNTNKPSGTPLTKVLKGIKENPDGTPSDNPFGSLIKERGGQSKYIDKDGNEQLSLINKRAEEGDWGEWADKLPSQFLSKQPKTFIAKQIKQSVDDKQAEFDDIMAITNPTVKKELLQSFADDCDATAVHLKAAALPRQKYQVLFPIPTMKDGEVYAPNFDDGETVTLVRFPHGGIFEIPQLVVNNKQRDAVRLLGKNPLDAIGINAKVAQQLSGADFDGDTVMVIPSNSSKTNVKIAVDHPLKDLKGFDHKLLYGYDADNGKRVDEKGKEHYYQNGIEFKPMRTTNLQMGMISNLITDMTLKGANDEELARAVKHSMVVIDAEKHKLNYKKSEQDNGIAALRKRYLGEVDENGKYHEGASTLISRAGSETNILKRKGSPKINKIGKAWYDPSKPEGYEIWTPDQLVPQEYVKSKKRIDKETGKAVVDPNTKRVIYDDTGKIGIRTQKSSRMADTDDARKLISSLNTPQEQIYADYANKMKTMANSARKELAYTGNMESKPSAKKAYSAEVDSLLANLNIALKNAPRERQAQLIANSKITALKRQNPDLKDKELKKIGQQSLAAARVSVGAKKVKIPIGDKEWEAIQAGAISENQLKQIIRNADMDDVRRLATPRYYNQLSPGKVARIENYKASGYTNSQIASALNISLTTVANYIKK